MAMNNASARTLKTHGIAVGPDEWTVFFCDFIAFSTHISPLRGEDVNQT
jgi:hypothetical protein